MPETKQPVPVTTEVGSYKGSPTLTFREGPEDRFPFSFGPAKARKMLGYIDQHGASEFVALLRKLVAKE
jgi:hypothetical protein